MLSASPLPQSKCTLLNCAGALPPSLRTAKTSGKSGETLARCFGTKKVPLPHFHASLGRRPFSFFVVVGSFFHRSLPWGRAQLEERKQRGEVRYSTGGGKAKGLKTSRFNLPSLCLLSLSNSLPSCVFVVRPKRKIRCPRRKERKVEWSPVSVDELERDGREEGRRRMESGVERKKLLSDHARITGCCSCSHPPIPLSKCMRGRGGGQQTAQGPFTRERMFFSCARGRKSKMKAMRNGKEGSAAKISLLLSSSLSLPPFSKIWEKKRDGKERGGRKVAA